MSPVLTGIALFGFGVDKLPLGIPRHVLPSLLGLPPGSVNKSGSGSRRRGIVNSPTWLENNFCVGTATVSTLLVTGEPIMANNDIFATTVSVRAEMTRNQMAIPKVNAQQSCVPTRSAAVCALSPAPSASPETLSPVGSKKRRGCHHWQRP